MKTLFVLLAAFAPLLKDDFSSAKFATRRAMRGDWKFAEGTATCIQNDEFYKKIKDHGPILFYDLAYTDAAIRFAVKSGTSTKSVVFTATAPTATSPASFSPEEKDRKSIALGTKSALKLKPGEWTTISIELSAPQLR